MNDITWTSSTTPVLSVELPHDNEESLCRMDVEVTDLGSYPSHNHPGDGVEWRVLAFDVWVPATDAWLNLWTGRDGFPSMDVRSDWHKAIEAAIDDEIDTLRAMARA